LGKKELVGYARSDWHCVRSLVYRSWEVQATNVVAKVKGAHAGG